MNGRALFTYNPDLFVDDENAAETIDELEEEKENGDPNNLEESKVDNELFA